jgi:hypothetical protein
VSSGEEQFQAFATIPNWMVRDTTISGHAKLVYVCLTSRTSRTNASWPSHALIGREAGIGVTSVKTALNELKALGLVRWEKRTRDDGGATSNMYFISTTLPNPTP